MLRLGLMTVLAGFALILTSCGHGAKAPAKHHSQWKKFPGHQVSQDNEQGESSARGSQNRLRAMLNRVDRR